MLQGDDQLRVLFAVLILIAGCCTDPPDPCGCAPYREAALEEYGIPLEITEDWWWYEDFIVEFVETDDGGCYVNCFVRIE